MSGRPQHRTVTFALTVVARISFLSLLGPAAGCATFITVGTAIEPSQGASGPQEDGDNGPEHVPLEDWILVTEDNSHPDAPGCERITLFDGRSGERVAESAYDVSPGQIAATRDGRMVAAYANNGGLDTVLMRPFAKPPLEWVSAVIPERRPARIGVSGGAIAFALDDTALLMPLASGIEKYAVSHISDDGLGPVQATYVAGSPAAIEVSPDSRTAYVVATDGWVHSVDVEMMRATGPPIAYDPTQPNPYHRIHETFAALSPDGRYLAINSGDRAAIQVVDLASRSTHLVTIPGLRRVRGLRFNHAPLNHGLLAIHGEDEVGVLRFQGLAEPRLLASIRVPESSLRVYADCVPIDSRAHRSVMRFASIAWTGRGDGIIAATSAQSGHEFRVFDLSADHQLALQERVNLNACVPPPTLLDDCAAPSDVYTLNGRLWSPTATPSPTPPPPPPTATASAPPTSTPSPTASPTPAATASPTSTPSRAPTATPTSSPTVTPTPGPAFLPLALREACVPDQRRVDVVLVIDASTSMEERTAAGRAKIEAAVAAARALVDDLRLDRGDRAAVVAFNAEARLLQGLTAEIAPLEAALAAITIGAQTCLVCGVEAADAVLRGAVSRTGVQPAMVVLTDGRSNPRPAEEAVGRAGEAKARGVAVFTVGLGDDVDAAALAAMASRPAYAYRTTDAEALGGIYRAIAVAIPCPPAVFWGGR